MLTTLQVVVSFGILLVEVGLLAWWASRRQPGGGVVFAGLSCIVASNLVSILLPMAGIILAKGGAVNLLALLPWLLNIVGTVLLVVGWISSYSAGKKAVA